MKLDIRSAVGAVALANALLACSQRSAGKHRPDAVDVRAAIHDSSGITIVENPGLDAKVERWTLDSAPMVTIGGEDQGPEYLFDQIVGVRFLRSGEILLAEYSIAQAEGRLKDNGLRMFDSTGRFVRRFGRYGNGPGEFQLLHAFFLAGDSIWVYDIDARRGTSFDRQGRYGRTLVNVPSVESMIGRLSTGGWIALGDRIWKPFQGRRRDTVSLVKVDDNGKAIPLRRLPSEELTASNDGASVTPFTTRPKVWVDDSLIFAGSGDRYEIGVHSSDGTLRRIIRRDVEPKLVTPKVVAEWLEAVCKGSQDPGCRVSARASTDKVEFPKTMPVYAAFLTDEAGDLWVEEYHHPNQPKSNTSWDVFDPNGMLVAVATLAGPEGLEIAAVRSDRVAFLSRETAQIMIYRLKKVLVSPR